ncbi:NAD-dependent epimerase/dehydratase family protein [Nocardioides convexus]|uniref:NAD-dependent epimerase/dehydratase family protein n=1 Tax=Nocardioides convexus TaxID=2712224 RepID=UPI0024185A3A|nr:NAD-dependent epimerase/dehydratase family protein [Nocardioides convexus]
MGTYAVTGSASGMGAAVVDRLVGDGHRVIGIDIQQADVTADLSTPAGRRAAAAAVLEKAGGVLDGAVLAAGLGPAPGRDRARLIAEVNVLGVTESLEAWRPALAAADRAKVVVFASNSTTTVPLVPGRVVRALAEGDVERAVRTLRLLGKAAPTFAYAASKTALAHWVRRNAVTPAWAGAGIRLNALAPGAIMTPLLEQQTRHARRGAPDQGLPGAHRRLRRCRPGSPRGWCSCSPTRPTSCAAAWSSSTAARTPGSAQPTGRARCPPAGCAATSRG